jgi:hypothetical protein
MKKKVLLNIEEGVLAKLKRRARTEGVARDKTVSVNDIVREAIDAYLAEGTAKGGYDAMILAVARHLADQNDSDL